MPRANSQEHTAKSAAHSEHFTESRAKSQEQSEHKKSRVRNSDGDDDSDSDSDGDGDGGIMSCSIVLPIEERGLQTTPPFHASITCTRRPKTSENKPRKKKHICILLLCLMPIFSTSHFNTILFMRLSRLAVLGQIHPVGKGIVLWTFLSF